MTTKPDTDWMTRQELWVWEQIRDGNLTDLSDLPQEIRNEIGDGDKPAVTAPLTKQEDGTLQPAPDEDWPEWQVLRGDFIERVLRETDFHNARRRNEVGIRRAYIRGVVQLNQEHIPGSVYLDSCKFEDAVELYGADISGVLSFRSSHLAKGFEADGLKTGGDVFLRDGARFDGDVRLLGAVIGGGVDCSGSQFVAGQSEHALKADGLKTDGDVFLGNGARFDGEVRLLGAVIGGDLACAGSQFQAGNWGDALSADGLRTGGSVFLRNGARFDGEVRLLGADIGGVVDCSGSQFQAGDSGDVLNADGLQTAGNVFLRNGARFDGNVIFDGAVIHQDVQICGSCCDGEIRFQGVKVTGALVLEEDTLGTEFRPPEWGEAAFIDLQNAKFGALQGKLSAWKRADDFIRVSLDGLSVDRLAGGVGGHSMDTDEANDIIRWIENGTPVRTERGRGFSQSPYVTIAHALESAGLIERARKIRIALENRRTRQLEWKSWNEAPRRIGRTLLGWINAYGYRPYRGLLIAAILVPVFALLGFVMSIDGQIWPLYPQDGPTFAKWLGYSLEQMVPFVDLDPIDDNFIQNQWGVDTNEFGYAPYDDRMFWVRALFMFERIVGVTILTMSLAGIAAWAERRS